MAANWFLTRWMAANMAISRHPAATERMDSIVQLIMAPAIVGRKLAEMLESSTCGPGAALILTLDAGGDCCAGKWRAFAGQLRFLVASAVAMVDNESRAWRLIITGGGC